MPLRGSHVLVAEDDWFLATAIEDLLRSAGAVVLGPVPSVGAGLALLNRTPRLDAAVLDVNLGGEMVYPLADRLMARGVPLVFATAYGTDHGNGRFADAPHVTKVGNDEQVIRAVIQAVRQG